MSAVFANGKQEAECGVCHRRYQAPSHGFVVTRGGLVWVCSGDCFLKASEHACTLDEAEAREEKGIVRS
jgi:hypothetical protein